MTTHTLRRWGAVLLTGGLLLTAAYLIYPASAHDALIRPAAALGLAGVLLALPGLVAFQVAQSARARVPGWIGTVLIVLGIAALEIPHLVKGLFDPSSLYDLDAYHSSTFGAMEFYGIVALAVGMIVLAVATWRSGFYPRLAVLAARHEHRGQCRGQLRARDRGRRSSAGAVLPAHGAARPGDAAGRRTPGHDLVQPDGIGDKRGLMRRCWAACIRRRHI